MDPVNPLHHQLQAKNQTPNSPHMHAHFSYKGCVELTREDAHHARPLHFPDEPKVG